MDGELFLYICHQHMYLIAKRYVGIDRPENSIDKVLIAKSTDIRTQVVCE